MNPNKKIDRLFQEKLKDLEVTPPDIVWENIEAHLDKKKKKRVIPLWWKMTGAAAILLSIATGGFYFLNTPSNSIPVENTITNTKIDSLKEFNNKLLPPTIPVPLDNQHTIVDSKKSTNGQLNSNPNVIKKSPPSETITSSEIQSELDEIISKTATEETDKTTRILLTNSSNQSKTNTINNSSNKIEFQLDQTNKPTLHTDKNELVITNPLSTNSIDSIEQKQSDTDRALTSNTKKLEESNSNTVASNTTITSINTESSSLETTNILNHNEDELPEKTTISNHKWTVASIIAPVFYNSFNSKGSPMGNQFESNPKEGSNSIAYGIKVGYKINNKISIQSGLSIMDIGYSVNEVYMNPTGLTVAKLSNVNYNSTSKIIDINASKELSQTRPLETSTSDPLQGSLNQEYGYIEVPLELKYNLIGGKFKVHLITGFSTLILNGNKVYVENSEFSSNLGEANNLNDINFSGNFGFDFDYSLNKNLYINVAPIFKIYMNTFSKKTDNFEPYAIGIYTGLNYRFD